MYQQLKQQVLSEDLERLREATHKLLGTMPLSSSLQVSQHSAFLGLLDKYQQSLAQLKQQLEKEQTESRKQSQRAEKMQVELQAVKQAMVHQFDYQRMKFTTQLQYKDVEIGKLRSTIQSLKRAASNSEREKGNTSARRASTNKQHEDLMDDLETKSKELSIMKNERVGILRQLNEAKQMRMLEKARMENELKTLKEQINQLEKTQREITTKNRNIQQDNFRKQQQLQHMASQMHRTENRFREELKNRDEQVNKSISKLKEELEVLRVRLAKKQAEVEWREESIHKYEQQLDQYRKTERQMLAHQLYKKGTATQKKQQIRNIRKPKNQDPEEEGGEESLDLQEVQPVRQPPKRHSLGRHPPVALIKDREQYKKCRCERYKQKLKEANQKIMSLLTQKCRDKIQLSHLRKNKIQQTTTLDLDFDNIVCL